MHNNFINIPYQDKNIPYYNADIQIFPLIGDTAESFCGRGTRIYTGLWTLCLFALLMSCLGGYSFEVSETWLLSLKVLLFGFDIQVIEFLIRVLRDIFQVYFYFLKEFVEGRDVFFFDGWCNLKIKTATAKEMFKY